ncbi:MAG: hypothetical protein ACR2OW_08675, partial [Methyloligellaceae bacterium]
YDEILKSWRMGHEYLKWSNRTAEWQRIFASGPLGSLMGSLNPWIPNLNSAPNLWTPSAASAFEPFMKPFAPGFNGSQPMQELNVMSPFMIWQWSDQQRRA